MSVQRTETGTKVLNDSWPHREQPFRSQFFCTHLALLCAVFRDVSQNFSIFSPIFFFSTFVTVKYKNSDVKVNPMTLERMLEFAWGCKLMWSQPDSTLSVMRQEGSTIRYGLAWINYVGYFCERDRLCGLVVRVSGYRYRGSGFDPRRYQIFWVVVGLERGQLSLVKSKWGATWIKK